MCAAARHRNCGLTSQPHCTRVSPFSAAAGRREPAPPLWHKHKPGRVMGFHPGAPLTSGPWEPAPLFHVPGGGAFDCYPESPARLSTSGHRGSWLSNSLLGWLSFLPFVRLPLDILPLLFPGIPFQNKLPVPKPCSWAFSRPQLRPGLDKLSTPRQVGRHILAQE